MPACGPCLALGKTCAAEPDAITLHVRAAAELAPRLQAAAERYMTLHRRASVVIVRGGSVFGLKSLLHESADVAMVYGPPPLVMREALRERRNSLDSVLIEQLPLTPVVHPGNPLREIPAGPSARHFCGRHSRTGACWAAWLGQ